MNRNLFLAKNIHHPSLQEHKQILNIHDRKVEAEDCREMHWICQPPIFYVSLQNAIFGLALFTFKIFQAGKRPRPMETR